MNKYYSTLIMTYGEKAEKLKELGYKGTHYQFIIVCKAKSMAEANRQAEKYGLGTNVFKRKFTHETGNELQIKMADKYGFIISLDGTYGDKFIGINSII